ncbi:MAG: hypothetical protein E7422_02115 [Ruminococcaceae bacterium]|nr:hypothetical protein [Oscillospiraceae bacterium]
MGVYLLIFAVNWGCSLALRGYIRSFEPVAYDTQLVPVYDEALGHYTIRSDRELKIMMLSDLVVLGGDNTFAVPGPVYRGGGTLDTPWQRATCSRSLSTRASISRPSSAAIRARRPKAWTASLKRWGRRASARWRRASADTTM